MLNREELEQYVSNEYNNYIKHARYSPGQAISVIRYDLEKNFNIIPTYFYGLVYLYQLNSNEETRAWFVFNKDTTIIDLIDEIDSIYKKYSIKIDGEILNLDELSKDKEIFIQAMKDMDNLVKITSDVEIKEKQEKNQEVNQVVSNLKEFQKLSEINIVTTEQVKSLKEVLDRASHDMESSVPNSPLVALIRKIVEKLPPRVM
ncbi:hypothetical protein NST63_26630 [Heyndrickxia sp. FSL W8-0496]|uniref:hypothetical protein n=1 Tax=Heyndrickxia TaxID=2837504 RepID=UPI0007170EB7